MKQKLHELMLAALRSADDIDWSRAAVDSSTNRSVGGGEDTGPNRTDRGKPRSEHHIIIDGHAVPLEVQLSAASKPDVMPLVPLLTNLPRVTGKIGHPQSQPNARNGDRGYDSEQVRELLGWPGINLFLCRRGTSNGKGLGKLRYVVARPLILLHQQRRLRTRYEPRKDIKDSSFWQQAWYAFMCVECFVGRFLDKKTH